MDARIGTLDVSFIAEGIDPVVAARLPALTRSLQRDLSESLDRSLSASVGDGHEVYVIRELTASTTLTLDAIALDRTAVDHVSGVYATAIAQRLARPDDEEVRKFADTADFITAFIVGELSGGVSDRWEFGAFRKYRQADAKATIEAVLAAHPRDVVVVLGRLARHGRLEALIALLGASSVLALVDVETSVAGAGGASALVDAALRLVSLTGWVLSPELRALLRHALLLEHRADAPDWSDRGRLSQFVWARVEDAVGMMEARGHRRVAFDRRPLKEALGGPLDWLDSAWMLGRVDEHAGATSAGPMTPPTPDPLRVVVERLTRELGSGRLVLRREDEPDVAVTRLLAAADLSPDDVHLVRRLRRLITEVVDLWRAAAPRENGAAVNSADASISASPSGPRPSARRLRGLAERDLAAALEASTDEPAERSEHTAGAGLYLLCRAVLDMGLPGLAKVHGVPLPPLLAAMATRWLDLQHPFDPPVLMWTGAARPEEVRPMLLLAHADGLSALDMVLVERRRSQRGAPLDELVAREGNELAEQEGADASLDRIAEHLMRAWSRWLRGLESSSSQFLVDRAVRRAGAVRFTDSRVVVMVEPAALDVVLNMAGYLKPIEAVPWLGGRSVVFDVVRHLRS